MDQTFDDLSEAEQAAVCALSRMMACGRGFCTCEGQGCRYFRRSTSASGAISSSMSASGKSTRSPALRNSLSGTRPHQGKKPAGAGRSRSSGRHGHNGMGGLPLGDQ